MDGSAPAEPRPSWSWALHGPARRDAGPPIDPGYNARRSWQGDADGAGFTDGEQDVFSDIDHVGHAGAEIGRLPMLEGAATVAAHKEIASLAGEHDRAG